MLIVEELYLLLTNRAGKQERPGTLRAYGEAAALVTDLMVAGRVRLSEHKVPRVHLGSTEPLGHPVLDFGLQRLAQKKDGTRLDTLVTWSKLDPEEQVVASLVDAGVLTFGSKTMLGLGRPSTPEIDPAPEGRLRARLAEVLLGRAAPTVADASLLSILVGLGVAQHLLSAESGGLKGRRLKQRVVELSAQTAAGSAVGRAVDGMNAALMTAVIVPAAVAGSG